MGSRPRLHGGRLFAGEFRVNRAPTRDAPTEMAKVGARMKDGFQPLSSRGEGAPSREAPFGVRKRGWIPAPVFTVAGSSREKRVGCAWVEGRAVLEPPLREGRVRLE